MKILILGHYEIASNYAISLVVNKLFKQHDVRIMLSGRGDAFEGVAKNFEQNTFAALAHYEQTLCDELKVGENSLSLQCDSFDVLAEKTRHSIEILDTPNSKKGLQKVADFAPDLVISIRYRKILKEAFIEIPEMGIINLHSGRLPDYRGAMATFWSMLNSEEFIGSTVHYITDGRIDTGEIIAMSEQATDYSKSYFENLMSLYQCGCQNIIGAVNVLVGGDKPNSFPQQSKGKYYSFPTIEELNNFILQNMSLL